MSMRMMFVAVGLLLGGCESTSLSPEEQRERRLFELTDELHCFNAVTVARRDLEKEAKKYDEHFQAMVKNTSFEEFHAMQVVKSGCRSIDPYSAYACFLSGNAKCDLKPAAQH